MILLWLLACTPARRELPVFAAASLADAFGALEADFERANPQVDVLLAFAGSQVLRAQIAQGAPARVFASADREHVDRLVADGLASEPARLATNALVLALAPGNPAGIEDLRGLATAERVVLAAPEVPAGAYATALLDRAAEAWGEPWRAAVQDRVISLELSIRAVSGRLARGEADAGLVYATDARAAGLTAVPLPDGWAPGVELWTALIPPVSADARAWQAHVQGSGRAILDAHGFGSP